VDKPKADGGGQKSNNTVGGVKDNIDTSVKPKGKAQQSRLTFSCQRRIIYIRRMIFERMICMATVSFDKNVIITEPDAVQKLVDSLLNDKPRTIDRELTSPTEVARGEQLLKQYLSRSKS
jgi:hypothetical protein